MSLRPRALPPRVKAAVTAVGLLCAMTMVWQSTAAVFTATTSNPANSWAAGSVTVGDDDGANVAMFSTAGSTANLIPGNTASRCIKVTYTGSLTAPTVVKVYATGLAGTGLGPYLLMSIEEDSNQQGAFVAGCGTFAGTFIHQAATPAASTGTLGYFAANMTTYASGVGTWAPTASGQFRVYRFTYYMQNDDLAQGLNVTVNFVWETHSA